MSEQANALTREEQEFAAEHCGLIDLHLKVNHLSSDQWWDVLVIDDLGTELVTRYTQAEVYDLVNHRLNTGKPTIINTNLGLQEIERTYSSRVHSRLAGMYAVVQFRGRDIRLQKKQEG